MWLKSNPSQNFLNCGQSDSGWHSFSIDNLSSKFEMWANNIFSHYHLLLIKFFQCKKTALSYREIEILFFKSCQHLIVVSSLGRNTKILNFELQHIECPNIELSEHHILAQNWTSNMLNITKNWTVRKHQRLVDSREFAPYRVKW